MLKHLVLVSILITAAGAAFAGGVHTYKARTDFNVAQIPSPLPTIGPAGSTFTDPNFDTTILRVTDGNTYNNASFEVSDAGAVNAFNVDSTRFFFSGTGGTNFVADLDPTTLAVIVWPWNPPVGPMTWSRVNRDVLYVVPENTQQIVAYTLTDPGITPTSSLIFDFATVLPISPIKWTSEFFVSVDDETFSVSFSSGPQDSAQYAFTYTVGLGWRIYDTLNGMITGNWGLTGSVNIPDRFTLHEVTLSKLGDYVILGQATLPDANPYFWNLDTRIVQPMSNNIGGHPAQGYKHFLNEGGAIGTLGSRPYANLSEYVTVVSNVPPGLQDAPFGRHSSYNNVDPLDENPVLAGTYGIVAPNPMTAAWQNEVILQSPMGLVWREGHTFASNKSPYFACLYSVIAVSQDGRFAIGPSDMMGTLRTDMHGNPGCDIFVWVLH